jgi:hypothetical protein
MDKFGIFNLLGSLLNQNSTQNQQNVGNSNNQKTDLLSSLSSLFSNKLAENSTTTPETKKEVRPIFSSPPPLQYKMIHTMTSHDEFVKRVKKNNPR